MEGTARNELSIDSQESVENGILCINISKNISFCLVGSTKGQLLGYEIMPHYQLVQFSSIVP